MKNNENDMQIPKEINAFEHPTLIVVADRMHAHFYLADERQVEETFAMDTNQFPLDDTEKIQKINPATGVHHGAGDEGIKEHVKAHMFERVAKELKAGMQKKEYEDLVLIVPEEYKNELKNELHTYVKKRLVAVVPKNLLKLPLVDTVKEAREAVELSKFSKGNL